MNNQRIAFIGGGNMARSLIGGLIADGYDPGLVCAADPSDEQRERLEQDFGIRATPDNADALARAEIVVLAVKPQVMRDVAVALAGTVQDRRPLVMSIAAGIREPALNRWLGGGVALVRCMPNTPSLVQAGATGLYANPQVSDAQRHAAETVMRAVGLTVWVEDEATLDAVTALSGSGPAYFFLVMEALENAGTELGLNREQARLLSLQTAFGAAKMALESDEDAATLRRRVTSPGGTTERAIGILQQGGLEALFLQALTGARDRCSELSAMLEKDA
jgi:pyrroline-5-carboxylate reductase